MSLENKQCFKGYVFTLYVEIYSYSIINRRYGKRVFNIFTHTVNVKINEKRNKRQGLHLTGKKIKNEFPTKACSRPVTAKVTSYV